MTYPAFNSGDVLNASDMNAVGLWLVKTQTVGSGVSTVTVTNAFSSAYDNYKIVYTGGVFSGGSVINLKLGASATGYYNTLVYSSYSSPAPAAVARNNGVNFGWIGFGDTTYTLSEINLYQPYLAKNTGMSATYMYSGNAGTSTGMHQVATSYTDFTLGLDSAVTMTGGTIRVYGYRN